MPKKKETFAPVHMKELSLEEQGHAEKILIGEYQTGRTKEDLDRRIKSFVQDISEKILEDMQHTIDVLKYNIAQLVIVRQKTKEELAKAPRKLSCLVSEELKGRKK